MALHSSTLAWRIPWTEEPSGLQSMGSLRVRHDFTFTFHFHELEKEMATHSSVLAWIIPGTGEPGGLPSMGSHRVGLSISRFYLDKWSWTGGCWFQGREDDETHSESGLLRFAISQLGSCHQLFPWTHSVLSDFRIPCRHEVFHEGGKMEIVDEKALEIESMKKGKEAEDNSRERNRNVSS